MLRAPEARASLMYNVWDGSSESRWS
jgi:hypothetical protein